METKRDEESLTQPADQPAETPEEQEEPEEQGFKAYSKIIRTKEAYSFDLSTLLMRFYLPMITLGVVSMITLAGHSALFAGSVSSTVAAALLFISPRISKLIDERGQSAVVPWAASIAMVGLFTMLVIIHFGLPNVLCYPCAILMGFAPSPQALARTRWLFLIETGKLGQNPPPVRSVFSFEGILDDVAFMIGPALCISLGASLFPVAGMLVGGVSYSVGAILLMLCRKSEPDERWRVANLANSPDKKQRSVLASYSSVRMLFLLMMLMGGTFAVFDTTTVAFTEGLGKPTAASYCLIASAIISIAAGFAFGGIKFKMTPAKLLAITASMFGVLYGTMLFIETIPALFIVSVIGAFSYAPFFISTNNMCERCVPKSRITEALTWVSAGFACGSAIGPTLAGFFVDTFGATAGFDAGAVFSFAILPVALVAYRIIKRDVKQ